VDELIKSGVHSFHLLFGGAENAGPEDARHEVGEPKCRIGKCET